MIFLDGEWIDAAGFTADEERGRLTSYSVIDTSAKPSTLSVLLDWSELIEMSRPFDERETVEYRVETPR